MKRPQGFDRSPGVPPVPPVPPIGGGTSATPSRRGTVAPLADAATEPITVITVTPDIAPVASFLPAAGQGEGDRKSVAKDAAKTNPKFSGKERRDTSGVTPSKAASDEEADGTLSATGAAMASRPLTPRTARKQFRAARRARKQYERDEVRRFTWRARRRRMAWLTSGGVLVALILFVVIGAYSPLMALRTIEVVGSERVSAAEIQSALADQVGTPLPLVDFDAVKAELATFPLIASYVTESRPPGTLVIRVVERVPVGLVASATGFDLVDAAGVVISRSGERVPGYPVMDAKSGTDSTGFRAAAEVIAALPENIRSQLDTATATTRDDVTLGLVGGARVVWGSAERSEYKAVVLGALLVGHPAGTVGEYDVSSPDSAVIR